jgi:hypothetical protein
MVRPARGPVWRVRGRTVGGGGGARLSSRVPGRASGADPRQLDLLARRLGGRLRGQVRRRVRARPEARSHGLPARAAAAPHHPAHTGADRSPWPDTRGSLRRSPPRKFPGNWIRDIGSSPKKGQKAPTGRAAGSVLERTGVRLQAMIRPDPGTFSNSFRASR